MARLRKEHGQLFVLGTEMVFWVAFTIIVAVVYSLWGLFSALCEAVDKRT